MPVNHSENNENILLPLIRDPLADYKVVLFGYITPIFFLITLAANVMIVLVLSRPTMRSPTNLVLLSMAVADLLTLVFPVPWYFYMYTLGYYTDYLHPSLFCNFYNAMSKILPTFFHTASIWCTLLLACQRYIYICHPTLAKVWCTNQRVAKTILAIFLLSSVHQLLRFFECYYEDTVVRIPIGDDGDGANEKFIQQPACRLVQTKWIVAFEDLYFGTYFVFRIFFVHIGPCLLLVIFNVLLYIALKRAEITRNKLLYKKPDPNQKNGSGISKASQERRITGSSVGKEMQSQRKPNRGRDANSTTVMLIVVVTVFLIVEIPLAIVTAVHVTENMFKIDIVSDRFLYTTIIFSNFFIIISYPVNFAIYCGMSRAFRETFQRMFLRKLFTLRDAALPQQETHSTNTNTLIDRYGHNGNGGNVGGDYTKDSEQTTQKTTTETTTTQGYSEDNPINLKNLPTTPIHTDLPAANCNNSTELTITDLKGQTRMVVNHPNEFTGDITKETMV